MSDPGLWILADTVYLPRTEGLAGGTPIPAEQMRAIQALDAVKGTCTVPVASRGREALVCGAEYPGYAVRFSEGSGVKSTPCKTEKTAVTAATAIVMTPIADQE